MDLEYHFLIFTNLDLEWFRDGWIKIEISINIPLIDDPDPTPTPDPNDSESIDYSIIIYLVGGASVIIIVGAVVIQIKRKNERINEITQDSKAVQKYRIVPTRVEKLRR